MMTKLSTTTLGLAGLIASVNLLACDPLPGSPLNTGSATTATATAAATAFAADDPADVVLATVNGREITRGELDFWLMGGHGQRITPELRAQALDNLIETELMYQKGLELGLDKDAKYRAAVRDLELRLEAAKRKEMVRRIGNVEIAAKVQIKPEDGRAYFEANKAAITTDYHLGAITFPSVEAAQQAVDEIKAGKTFEEVAERSAPRRPLKAEGAKPEEAKPVWDLGFLSWNQMPAEWAAAVGSMKVGEVSGVVQGARVGIRIFKVIETRANDKATFETVQGVIMNRLRDERVEAYQKKYVDDLKAKAKIARTGAPLTAPAGAGHPAPRGGDDGPGRGHGSSSHGGHGKGPVRLGNPEDED